MTPAGDFNQLNRFGGGGDNISPDRRGEPDLIINLMSDNALCIERNKNLAKWQLRDLILASEELAATEVNLHIQD